MIGAEGDGAQGAVMSAMAMESKYDLPAAAAALETTFAARELSLDEKKARVYEEAMAMMVTLMKPQPRALFPPMISSVSSPPTVPPPPQPPPSCPPARLPLVLERQPEPQLWAAAVRVTEEERRR